MASYYPEGECYFVRSSLRYASHWSAGNQSQFYNHVLLEYYWNGWPATGQTSRSHTRSQWRHGVGQGAGNNTRFGDWDRFFVGESRDRNPDNMLRVHSHPNSLNWNECRDHLRGGPRKYILRPVRIYDRNAQWLWIDATIPLRAIYFPVAQTTDQAFQNLCTYVVIDFKHRTQLDIINLTGQWQTIAITPHNGLGWRDNMTWGFKIPDIITYLTIPNKLRNPDQGLFRTKVRGDELVVCASSTRTWRSSTSILHHGDFLREMDLANILSATFGVEVGWRPYQYSSFLKNLVLQVVGLGLGFIPGVGPILSVAFGIAVQLLQDPKSFSHENVLDLSAAVLDSLIQASGRSQKYLAPDFLSKCSSCDGQQRQMPLTDEERERRKEFGEELNARLTEEMSQRLVIRSLHEQQLLLQGVSNNDNSPVEELESTTADAASDDELPAEEKTEEASEKHE
ncbi:hypothetical protein FSARC_7587 [Fusarium sarcochroum]|uniref:Uncharacterized protein n=1 Tax=Fusarium sarcochroum TaxID=1208366 RepID=A0A8H4TUU0_9HYPO|nr:hypothetical protein FSARC_7587 [Fusarium sarcochroum]